MAPTPDQPESADFVRSIVTDPKNVPDVMRLYGYPGASSEEGHERLYLSPDLTNYVEVPTGAILQRMAVPADQDPHGAACWWVKEGRGADLQDDARGPGDGPLFHWRHPGYDGRHGGGPRRQGCSPPDPVYNTAALQTLAFLHAVLPDASAHTLSRGNLLRRLHRFGRGLSTSGGRVGSSGGGPGGRLGADLALPAPHTILRPAPNMRLFRASRVTEEPQRSALEHFGVVLGLPKKTWNRNGEMKWRKDRINLPILSSKSSLIRRTSRM